MEWRYLLFTSYYNDVTFNLIQFQILCFVFALRRNIKRIIITEEKKKKNIWRRKLYVWKYMQTTNGVYSWWWSKFSFFCLNLKALSLNNRFEYTFYEKFKDNDVKSRIYAKCVRTLNDVARRGRKEMLFFREHFSNKNDVLYSVCAQLMNLVIAIVIGLGSVHFNSVFFGVKWGRPIIYMLFMP